MDIEVKATDLKFSAGKDHIYKLYLVQLEANQTCHLQITLQNM